MQYVQPLYKRSEGKPIVLPQDKSNELQLWKTLPMFSICCHARRSPENGDTTDGIAFAWSIMFISESDLLCLTVQVDGAGSGASELGKLRLSLL